MKSLGYAKNPITKETEYFKTKPELVEQVIYTQIITKSY